MKPLEDPGLHHFHRPEGEGRKWGNPLHGSRTPVQVTGATRSHLGAGFSPLEGGIGVTGYVEMFHPSPANYHHAAHPTDITFAYSSTACASYSCLSDGYLSLPWTRRTGGSPGCTLYFNSRC